MVSWKALRFSYYLLCLSVKSVDCQTLPHCCGYLAIWLFGLGHRGDPFHITYCTWSIALLSAYYYGLLTFVHHISYGFGLAANFHGAPQACWALPGNRFARKILRWIWLINCLKLRGILSLGSKWFPKLWQLMTLATFMSENVNKLLHVFVQAYAPETTEASFGWLGHWRTRGGVPAFK